VLNAILYVAEHGCKWRGLPKRFSNWHTIYTRMNRWPKRPKSGVLDRVFKELQQAQVLSTMVMVNTQPWATPSCDVGFAALNLDRRMTPVGRSRQYGNRISKAGC
jgi:transposase